MAEYSMLKFIIKILRWIRERDREVGVAALQVETHRDLSVESLANEQRATFQVTSQSQLRRNKRQSRQQQKFLAHSNKPNSLCKAITKVNVNYT
jgi:hypothetical protein